LSTVDLTADGTTDAALAREGQSLASHSLPTRQRGEEIGNDNMKITLIVAVWTATATTTIGLASTAHADTHDEFQSPNGNIGCDLRTGDDGTGIADCEIRDHTWVIPLPIPKCPNSGSGVWGWGLYQGKAPTPGFSCVAHTLGQPGLQTVDYGQTRSAGAITCDSEPSGVTCTDTSTGHFFRVARDSYELG
jgi:hypothetical protein